MKIYELEKVGIIKENGTPLTQKEVVQRLNAITELCMKLEQSIKVQKLSLIANGYKVENGHIVFERTVTPTCRKEFATLEQVAAQLNLMANNIYDSTFKAFLDKLYQKK